MGLNCSHGAFDGSYSTFRKFRDGLLSDIGGKWDDNNNLVLTGEFSVERNIGLIEFFTHSDCQEEISPVMCKVVAQELESIRNHCATEHMDHLDAFIKT